ncbi:MAG: hypothetical protein ACRCTR_09670 [Actinomycetota bacterium]
MNTHPTTDRAQTAGRARATVLAHAVAVLTEAARLTRPVLAPDPTATATTTGTTCGPVWVETGRREPVDWAELVAAALAGAAANVGGIETALAGRPGSWESDSVRDLLTGTVGYDEEHLYAHRTEPVVVQVYVTELMVDLGTWSAYDDASHELDRRYDALGLTSASSSTSDQADQWAEPATADQEREQERQALAIEALDDRLEAQRLQDWADYGQALRVSIEAAAARRHGLAVPVLVEVNLHDYRHPDRPEPAWDLAEQLLQEAIDATPLPGNGQPPLDRLTSTTTSSSSPEEDALEDHQDVPDGREEDA